MREIQNLILEITQKLQEDKSRRKEEEQRSKEQARLNQIAKFREEFSLSEKMFSDSEIEIIETFIVRHTVKLGYANYMIDKKVVQRILRSGNSAIIVLYVREGIQDVIEVKLTENKNNKMYQF